MYYWRMAESRSSSFFAVVDPVTAEGVAVEDVPVEDVPVEDVAAQAWREMRALTHHPDVLRRVHQIAEEIGLTPAVAKALTHLSPDHPTPMRELAGALRCDNSYVTAVVDGLEKRELARRLPHPTDRRVKIIELTERGSALAGRVRAELDEPPPAFAGLSVDEATTLLGLLRKLSG
jgi:DNA-binding MarR family transcriptional regulator